MVGGGSRQSSPVFLAIFRKSRLTCLRTMPSSPLRRRFLGGAGFGARCVNTLAMRKSCAVLPPVVRFLLPRAVSLTARVPSVSLVTAIGLAVVFAADIGFARGIPAEALG